MPRIDKQVSIAASQERVWSVLADLSGLVKWAPTVAASSCSTDVVRGVGAKRIIHTTTGEVTEEVITEWDEGRSFSFEIPKGLASVVAVLRETWRVDSVPHGSVVVVTMDYEMQAGFIKFLVGILVVGRVLEKMLIQNLAGLKYHVETGALVTPKTSDLPVASVG